MRVALSATAEDKVRSFGRDYIAAVILLIIPAQELPQDRTHHKKDQQTFEPLGHIQKKKSSTPIARELP